MSRVPTYLARQGDIWVNKNRHGLCSHLACSLAVGTINKKKYIVIILSYDKYCEGNKWVQ